MSLCSRCKWGQSKKHHYCDNPKKRSQDNVLRLRKCKHFEPLEVTP